MAIVKGGGGIGRAIVDTYVANGAKVLAVDLPGRDWQSHFKDSDAVVCLDQDVTAQNAPQNIMDACVMAFGGLDILVNDAGIAIGGQFEETTDEQWNRILGINVTSIFRVSKAAVPLLRTRGGERIVNLGSIRTALSQPFFDDQNFPAYWEAKAPMGRIDDPKHCRRGLEQRLQLPGLLVGGDLTYAPAGVQSWWRLAD